MKKTSLLLSIVMAAPVFASNTLQKELPMAAYDSLAKVFPLEKLTERDTVSVEGEIFISSKLYLVSLNNSVMAVSEDGKHLISGDIVDLETMENHTEVAKRNTVKRTMESITSDTYVRYPVTTGNAKAVLYIYSDLSCGYCQLMHKEYNELVKAGVEIRMIPFLRTFGAPNVENTQDYKNTTAMMSIQDQDARRKLHDKLIGGIAVDLPDVNSKGAEAVQVGVDSGIDVGLRGTPHIVFPDGSTSSGFMKAQELIKRLGL
jgi:thiol:disulfide interchange protein DsbC